MGSGRLAVRIADVGGGLRKRRLLVGGVQGMGLLDGLLGGDQRGGEVGYLAVLHGELLGQGDNGDRRRTVSNSPGGRLVGRVPGRMAGVWLGVWQARIPLLLGISAEKAGEGAQINRPTRNLPGIQLGLDVHFRAVQLFRRSLSLPVLLIWLQPFVDGRWRHA